MASNRLRHDSKTKIVSSLSVDKEKNKLKENTLIHNSRTMDQFRKEVKYCDFEIRISNQIYHAHKIVLSSASPYFEAMFGGSEAFVESANNYVEMKDIEDGEIVELILHYIYTGDIDVNCHNVQDVAHLASIFQLTPLLEHCCQFLEQSLKPSNCVGILCFADLYGLSDLCFEAKRFIERNFAEIIKEDEFLELSPKLFKSFLKSENLSIESEYQVLTSTLRWILYKEKDRLDYLNEFIDIVRLPVIPREQLEKHLLSCSQEQVREVLTRFLQAESLEHQMEMGHERPYNLIRCQPRMCARRLFYLVGGRHLTHSRRSDIETLSLVEKFDLHTRTWIPTTPLSYPRSNHCLVNWGGRLFVIGGMCDSLILDSMEIYDTTVDKCGDGAKLCYPRSHFGACAYQSAIYAIGGMGEAGHYVEQYNLEKNKWVLFDEMPIARFDLQVIAHQGFIYIIGGQTQYGRTNSVLSYSPQKHLFSELAPLNTARACFAATILHDHIYVIGGIGLQGQVLNTVEQYNIKENKWSYLAPMPSELCSFCAVSINNLIYVFGGQWTVQPGNFKMVKTVQVYDPDQNSWLTSTPLTRFRSDAAVALV